MHVRDDGDSLVMTWTVLDRGKFRAHGDEPGLSPILVLALAPVVERQLETYLGSGVLSFLRV